MAEAAGELFPFVPGKSYRIRLKRGRGEVKVLRIVKDFEGPLVDAEVRRGNFVGGHGFTRTTTDMICFRPGHVLEAELIK